MGLDMYLSKKTYIWSETRKKLKIMGVLGIQSDKVKEIVEEAGYWRKANAIHAWFVANVQDGEDDCKEYEVSQEQLKELLELVKIVLKNSKLVKGKIQNGSHFENGKETPIMEDGSYIKNPAVAQKLLPCQEGFFFGSNNYDQYYIEDLKNTKKILENALKDERGDYYYQSSW